MKNKKLLLFILANCFTYAGAGRFDIDWVNYEDFATNKGKYEAGNKGVKVYKSDGTLSGIIEEMPNFDGVVNSGNYTLFSDSQLLSSVIHIHNGSNYDFLSRHLRKDVNLYNSYKDKVKNKNIIVEDFSEKSNSPYYFRIGNDFSIGRTDKIIFDAKAYETVDNWSDINKDDLIARVGGGLNTILGGRESGKGSAKYGYLSGGMNKLTGRNDKRVGGNEKEDQTVTLEITEKPKTALDIGTNSGDSGSPLFWWDIKDKKWKIIAANSAGSTMQSFPKFSILVSDIGAVKKIKDAITDREISDENEVTFENGILKLRNENRTFDKSDIENKTYIYDIPKLDSKVEGDVAKLKNQIFNKNGLIINLVGNTDTSIARLEFKEDATIKGNGTLKTAGYIVDENKTLTYEAMTHKGNIIRKIGKGILKIKGNNENNGEINIGEGTLILENNGKAASKIRVAQGAKVILENENQLNDNHIYFGLRGGILDQNGKNLKFSDIFHIDKGAIITNSKSNTKSIFELDLKDDKERVFLGKFTENLDVKFNPSNQDAKWDLRGNSDIKGDLLIERGNVSISGDNAIHGFENLVSEDEYYKVEFKSSKIELKNSSSLTINRASFVNSEINVDNGSKLKINAIGTVITERDKTKAFENSKSEAEINEIVLDGAINFKGNNEFSVNLENNNKARIESKVSGNISLEKIGMGELYLKNENSSLNGTINLNNGKIKVLKETTLGNTNTNIKNSSILEVENTFNLGTLLDKVNKNSSGILSLGENVNSLDEKYKEYTNLYLGSSKNIVIGNENTAISENIKTINLGGDGGTVTLKGLDKNNTSRTINVGDGINSGTVIIDKIVDSNELDINIRSKTNLVINNNTSIKKFLNLDYGSSVSYSNKSNLKNNALGILLLGDTDGSNVENVESTFIGSKKGKTNILTGNINTGDKYRFSGDGILKINEALTNKDLVVDAQYLEGGVVEIDALNDNYTGLITIMGNKNGENKGSIALKYSYNFKNDSNGMMSFPPIPILKVLGANNKNTYLIKDGGSLELDGIISFNMNMKFHQDNNKYGSIVNNATRVTNILNIYSENDELTKVNNKIVGNFKINKMGSGKLEFTNEKNNFFTGKDRGEIVVKEGTLIYKISDALDFVKVTLEDDTKLEAGASNIKAEIIAKGGNIDLILPEESNKKINIHKIKLEKDLVINGYNKNNDNSITYRNLELNDKKVTFKNQVSIINNILDKVDSNENEMEFDNSILYLSGSNNRNLNKNKVDKITLKNSNILLRDFSNTDEREDYTDIKILGESSIQNGSYFDNGGGAGANIKNKIILENGNILNFKAIGTFSNIGLNVLSNVVGDGKIKLYGNSPAKLVLKNNFKDFKGTLESMSNNFDFKYDITSNKEEDRTISYEILNGNYSNISNQDLIFKKLNNFNGNIKAESGNIVLYGENALKNNGKIILKNSNNLVLKSDNDVEVIELNVERENSDSSKIIKDNEGSISIRLTNSNSPNKLESKSGLIILKDDAYKKINEYNFNGGNIGLDSNEDINLNLDNKVFINNKNNTLIKLSNNNLILNANKLKEIKNINVESGKLNLNDAAVDEMIDSKITIENGAVFSIDADSYIKNILNKGKIILDDKKLLIDNYEFIDGAKFDLNVVNDKKLLEIKNSINDGSINLKIKLDNNLKRNIISNNLKVAIANFKNDVNLIEDENNEVINSINVLKKSNNDVVLIAHKNEKALNNIYFLNELNLISSMKNENIFKNNIGLEYINYNKFDNENVEFDDVNYKNKLNANGFKLNLSYVKNLKDVDILLALNYKNIYNKLYSSVSVNNRIREANSDFLITDISPTLAIKYGIFKVETELGYLNSYLFRNSEADIKYKVDILKHRLDFSVNPIFKISEKLNLEYKNIAGYVYTPFISENISNDNIKVKNETPIFIYYNTGLKLKHKYIDSYVDINSGLNFSKIKLEKSNDNSEKIENSYKDFVRFNMIFGLEVKPISNFTINTNLNINLNRSSNSNYLFNLGLGYNW